MLKIPRVNEQVMNLKDIEKLFNEGRFKRTMESNIAHILRRTGKRTTFSLTTKTSDIYTDGKKIVVGLPEEYIGMKYGEIYSMVKACVGHESAHVKWSNFSSIEPYLQEVAKRNVSTSLGHSMFNIIEDGRIERLLCEELPGYAKHIKFLNLKLIKKDGKLKDAKNVLGNIIGVIHFLAVLGVYPANYKQLLEKKEIDLIESKIHPLVLKGVMTNSYSVAQQVCLEIIDLLKAYIPEQESMPQELMDLLEALAQESYQSSEGKDGDDDENLDNTISSMMQSRKSSKSSGKGSSSSSQKQKNQEKENSKESEDNSSKESSKENASSSNEQSKSQDEENSQNQTGSDSAEKNEDEGQDENSSMSNSSQYSNEEKPKDDGEESIGKSESEDSSDRDKDGELDEESNNGSSKSSKGEGEENEDETTDSNDIGDSKSEEESSEEKSANSSDSKEDNDDESTDSSNKEGSGDEKEQEEDTSDSSSTGSSSDEEFDEDEEYESDSNSSSKSNEESSDGDENEGDNESSSDEGNEDDEGSQNEEGQSSDDKDSEGSENDESESSDEEQGDENSENGDDEEKDSKNVDGIPDELNEDKNSSDGEGSDNNSESSDESSDNDSKTSDNEDNYGMKDDFAKPLPNHFEQPDIDEDSLSYDEEEKDFFENLQEEIEKEAQRAFEKIEKEERKAKADELNAFHEGINVDEINSNYSTNRQEPNFRFIYPDYPTSKPQPEFKMKIHGLKKTFEKMLKNDETHYKGQKRGRLDTARLWRLGVNDDSVFKKKNVVDRTDYAVEILFDVSGSMRRQIKYKNAVGTAICIESALMDLEGVEVKTVAFNFTSGTKMRVLKDFKDKESKTPSVYHADITGGCNRDGFAIRVALNELKKHRAKNKLLIVISDGMPSCSMEKTDDALADVKSAVHEGRKDATIVSILINDGPIGSGTKDVFHYMYEDKGSIMVDVVHNPEDLMKNIVLYLKRMFRK